MTPAEVACCLSHRGVLEDIVGRKLPYALVLEDDADVDADLLNVCRDLVSESYAAWELVRLQTLKGRVRHPQTPRDLGVPICATGRRTLYRLKGHVLGASAYLITYSGAVKMLDHGERIFLPFDHAMDRFWENGLLPYVVRPFPVRHRDGVASEIGARGWAAFGESRGLLRIKQRGRRLSDSLRKRLFNLCLEDPVAAWLLSLVGLRVARTARAASAQLGARKTPLTASASTIVYLEADGLSVQKSRRKPSETVRGRSGVTSGADRTLKGLP
jgi:glycosyl transferase, family 25